MPHPVMNALSQGVPVTLVMDLLSSEGPDSREILQSEPPPAEQWWAHAEDSSTS